MLKLTFLLSLYISIFSCSISAQFHPDSLSHIEVQGNDTDPFITFDGNKMNQVFYNPTSVSNTTLLLHLVGTIDDPNSTTLFPSIAANNGFHCINLAYRNSVSGQTACGNTIDTNCHLNYRKEIIEGLDYSTGVNVNSANSINNRVLKLLQYLHTNFPSQNWNQYYSNSSILWNKFIVSGHSQGGGHAAAIAIDQPIKRVLMFGSPNDFIDTLGIISPWFNQPHIVPDSNYYGFLALHDEVSDFWKQYEIFQALNMDNFGDTIEVEENNTPFNGSHQLYTKRIAPTGFPIHLTHDIMIRDLETPLDLQGNPIFECVWKYMLGIDCTPTSVVSNQTEKVHIFPNPVKDILRIKNLTQEGIRIVLTDLLGKERSTYIAAGNEVKKIEMSSLESGIYLVQIFENDTLLSSKKIIKL